MRPFLVPKQRAGTRIDSMYSVSMDNLDDAYVQDEKARLTLQPKASFGSAPTSFCVYRVHEGRLYCPRFYGLQRWGPAETDARTLGAPVDVTFSGTLTPVQRQATDTVLSHHLNEAANGGAIVVLPCGMGKTVFAVHAVATLKRKTAVLVHTTVLKTQWKHSFEQFCPGVRVGFVQGNVFDVEDKDVVIMMVQTVAKRQFAFDKTDSFGVLICDEAHHIAAPLMNTALQCFRARYVLGLTATKERVDGCTCLLHWSLGPEAFRAERTSEAARVTVVHYRGAAREINTRDGRPLVAVMLNKLAEHAGRNAWLASCIAYLRTTKGRTLIVLSHRVSQLKDIRDKVCAPPHDVDPDDVGMLQASLKEADRASHLARPILLCTYTMADEGLDKKTLDTCVMATPKARVEQCIGRIQRPCETKQSPLVVDVADEGTFYVRLRGQRQRFYAKQKYEVQNVNADDEAYDRWF